jgi:hypothetical protein
MVHWVLCNPSLLIYKINPEPLDLLILNVLENSSSMLLVQHPQSVLHIESPHYSAQPPQFDKHDCAIPTIVLKTLLCNGYTGIDAVLYNSASSCSFNATLGFAIIGDILKGPSRKFLQKVFFLNQFLLRAP